MIKGFNKSFIFNLNNNNEANINLIFYIDTIIICGSIYKSYQKFFAVITRRFMFPVITHLPQSSSAGCGLTGAPSIWIARSSRAMTINRSNHSPFSPVPVTIRLFRSVPVIIRLDRIIYATEYHLICRLLPHPPNAA